MKLNSLKAEKLKKKAGSYKYKSLDLSKKLLDLEEEYKTNKISKRKFELKSKLILKGKSLNYWNNYYDNKANKLETEARKTEESIYGNAPNFKPLLISILLIFISLITVFSINEFTGFTIFETNTSSENQTLTSEISENQNLTQSESLFITVKDYSCNYKENYYEVCLTSEFSNLSSYYAKGQIIGSGINLNDIEEQFNSPFEYCIKGDHAGSYALHSYLFDSSDNIIAKDINNKVACEEVLGSNLSSSNVTTQTTTTNESRTEQTQTTENQTQQPIEQLTQENETNQTQNGTRVITIVKRVTINEETKQLQAVINQPVKWNKIINLSSPLENITVKLPSEADNIRIVSDKPHSVQLDGQQASTINLVTGGAVVNVDIKTGLKNWIKGLFSLTGFASVDVTNETEMTISNEVKDIVIEYETPAPEVIEYELENKKTIIVYSDYHYENILTYTSLPEIEPGNVKLIWKNPQGNTEHPAGFSDTNNNGLIDYAEWITPSLSNQTFEFTFNFTTLQGSLQNNTVADVFVYRKDFTDNTTSSWYLEANDTVNDRYIRINRDASMQLINATDVFSSANITISMWYKIDQNLSQSDTWLINKYSSTSVGWGIALQSPNNLSIFNDMGNANAVLYQNNTMLSGKWHHVVAQLWDKGTTVENLMYLDGKLAGRGQNITITQNVSGFKEDVYIGTRRLRDGSNNFFNGSLDEVKVWNTILTEPEILSLYQRGLLHQESNVSETGLVANYSFEGTFNDTQVNTTGSGKAFNMTSNIISTRSSNQSFPVISYLILTQQELTIIDASSNKTWMQFTGNNATSLDDANILGINTPSSVFAKNGKLFISASTVNTDAPFDDGLRIIDFVADEAFFQLNDTNSRRRYDSNISERNKGLGVSANATTVTLRSNDINDIFIKNISGSQYIAIAHASGVDIINETGLTQSNSTEAAEITNVYIDSNDDLIFSNSTTLIRVIDIHKLSYPGTFANSNITHLPNIQEIISDTSKIYVGTYANMTIVNISTFAANGTYCTSGCTYAILGGSNNVTSLAIENDNKTLYIGTGDATGAIIMFDIDSTTTRKVYATNSTPRIVTNDTRAMSYSELLADKKLLIGFDSVTSGGAEDIGGAVLLETTEALLKEVLTFEDDYLQDCSIGSALSGGIDNNGYLDLICLDGAPSVYTNNGTGMFKNTTWSSNISSFDGVSRQIGGILGDIDNDGDLDLIVKNNNAGGTNGNIQVYENKNLENFTRNRLYEGDMKRMDEGGLALGDIDNDGDLDLASGGTNTTRNVTINTWNGSAFVFNHSWNHNISNQPFTTGSNYITHLIDLDKNGWLDMVLFGAVGGGSQEANISVFINNQTNFERNRTWQNGQLFGIPHDNLNNGPNGVTDFAVFDINNDGYTDIFIGTDGTTYKFLQNNGGRNFTVNRTTISDQGNLTTGHRYGITTADFDNDGDYDIVYQGLTQGNGQSLNTSFFEWNGSSFIRNVSWSSNFTKSAQGSLTAIDINNDSKVDLIQAGADSNGDANGVVSRIYLNMHPKTNTRPSSPILLTSSYSSASGELILNWTNGSDTETPNTGLWYNIRVGTNSSGNQIMSGVRGGKNLGFYYGGNMGQKMNKTIKINLTRGSSVYWSVQSIDSSWQDSTFATEQQMFIPLLEENATYEQNFTLTGEGAIVAGDIDKDGYLDLVTMGINPSESNTLKVYIQEDSFNFTENTTWESNLTAGAGASFSTANLLDIDKDGDLDLFVIMSSLNGATNGSKVFINNGTAFLENRTWESNLTPVSNGASSFGDIDNDGDLDLALFGYRNGIQNGANTTGIIYENTGTSLIENTTWSTNITGAANNSAAAFVYINNDSRIDLIVLGSNSDGSRGSAVHINNGSNLLSNANYERNLETYDNGVSLVVGDIDNDGDMDFVASGNPNASVYTNNGTGFELNTTFRNNLTTTTLADLGLADLDDDGDLDLYETGREVIGPKIKINNGTGFEYNASFSGNLTTDNVTGSNIMIDINNDSRIDLIYFGSINSSTTSHLSKAFINKMNTQNSRPTAPILINASYDASSNNLTISWSNGSDAETPSGALYYNLRVGTSTGSDNVVSSKFFRAGRSTHGYYGNMQQRTNVTLKVSNPSSGAFFWSVQSIDSAWQSSVFPTEHQLIVDLVPNITQVNITPTNANTTDQLNCTFGLLDDRSTTLDANISFFNGTTLSHSINFTANNGTSNSRNATTSIQAKREGWFCRVRVSDGINTFERNSSNLTILNTLPSIPDLNISNNTIQLYKNNSFSWNASTDGDGEDNILNYTIEVSTNVSFSGVINNITLNSSNRNFTNTTLPNGILYWRIISYDGNNFSGYSLVNSIDNVVAIINFTNPSNGTILKPNNAITIRINESNRTDWSTNVTLQVLKDNNNLTNDMVNIGNNQWEYNYTIPESVNPTTLIVNAFGYNSSVPNSANTTLNIRVNRPTGFATAAPSIVSFFPEPTNIVTNRTVNLSVLSDLDTLLKFIEVNVTYPNDSIRTLSIDSSAESNLNYSHNYTINATIVGTYNANVTVIDINDIIKSKTLIFNSQSLVTFNLTSVAGVSNISLMDINTRRTINSSSAPFVGAEVPGEYNVNITLSTSNPIGQIFITVFNATLNQTPVEVINYSDQSETLTPPTNTIAVDQMLIGSGISRFLYAQIIYNYTDQNGSIRTEGNLQFHKCSSTASCTFSLLNSLIFDSINEGNNTNLIVGNFTNFSVFLLNENVATVTTAGSGGGGAGGLGATITGVSLSLNAPPLVSLETKDSITVPVLIRNPSTSLRYLGISLDASSSAPGLDLKLEPNLIDGLGPGQEKKINLIIDSDTPNGRYEVNLKAAVGLPKFSDTETMYVDVGRQEAEEVKAINQLEFAKELFKLNPDCLELSELLVLAEDLIKEKKYDKADTLAKSAVEQCRRLITARGKILQLPGKILETELPYGLLAKIVSVAIISTIVILLSVQQLFSLRRRKLIISAKKKEKKLRRHTKLLLVITSTPFLIGSILSVYFGQFLISIILMSILVLYLLFLLVILIRKIK